MATRTAVRGRPPVVPAPGGGLAQRTGKLGSELLLGLVLLAGGAVAVTVVFLLLIVAAPLAAALAAWLAWRSGDVTAREARRVRARLRRRARALGLVVLAGSRPTLLRLAAGARGPVPRPTR